MEPDDWEQAIIDACMTGDDDELDAAITGLIMACDEDADEFWRVCGNASIQRSWLMECLERLGVDD